MPVQTRKETKSTLKMVDRPTNVFIREGRWFVVKKFTVIRAGKKVRRQVWRRCIPETAERAAQIYNEIVTGIEALKFPVPKFLFSDVCDAFSDSELVDAVYSQDGKKIAGRRSLEGPKIIVRQLKDRFGHLDIRNISFGDISDFKNQRLRTPIVSKRKTRPRTIRSVNYELSFLRQIFRFAIQRRWLDRSPFQDGKGLIDGGSENRRYVTWTKDEELKALALCTDKSRHMKPFIILCVDGGLRPGECLSLKWSDVFDNHLIAKTYKGRNLQERKVLLSKRMKDVLDWWREIQKKYESRVSPDRRYVIGFRSVKGSWERIAKDIGRPDMIAHDLRHIYASRLAKAGVPITTISRALGHANIATTFRYIHIEPSDLASTIEIIDGLNAK
jgi:integrase